MRPQIKVLLQNSLLIALSLLFLITTVNEIRSKRVTKEKEANNQNVDQQIHSVSDQYEKKKFELNTESAVSISDDVNQRTKAEKTLKVSEKYRKLGIITLLNEKILESEFVNATFLFNYTGIEGRTVIQDLRVTDFKQPEVTIVHFHEPQSILFDMGNVQTVLNGHFVVQVAQVALLGSLRAELKQISIALTIDVIDSTVGDSLNVNVSSCEAKVETAHFTFDAESPFKDVIKTFQTTVNSEAKEHLPMFLCKASQRIINEQGADFLSILLEMRPNDAEIYEEKSKTDFIGAFHQKLERCKNEFCGLLKTLKVQYI